MLQPAIKEQYNVLSSWKGGHGLRSQLGIRGKIANHCWDKSLIVSSETCWFTYLISWHCRNIILFYTWLYKHKIVLHLSEDAIILAFIFKKHFIFFGKFLLFSLICQWEKDNVHSACSLPGSLHPLAHL